MGIWIYLDNYLDILNASTLHITPEILSLISIVDEFKGSWKAYKKLAPDQLNALKRVATIESIASSTRIEGSKLTDGEVEVLLSGLQIKKLDTRDEQEVAGYAAVMNTIFQHFNDIPLTENYIKQFHRDLLRYSEKDDRHRGEYKKQINHVEAFDNNGKSLGIIFETSTPFDTPFRMQHLVEWTNEAFEKKIVHPLIIIAIFIVEFLAIHPFQDGNGRLSRIITTWLLLKAGYSYTPYSSLEAIIENNKEQYYLSLRQTQGTLQSNKPDWQPWVTFFLKSLKQQKEKLEYKIEKEKLIFKQLPELSAKILDLIKSRGRITVKEIVLLTAANRNTIKKHLNELVKQNHIIRNGISKGAWYSLK